jgi:hypothetical protein
MEKGSMKGKIQSDKSKRKSSASHALPELHQTELKDVSKSPERDKRLNLILYVKESESDIPPYSGWNIPNPSGTNSKTNNTSTTNSATVKKPDSPNIRVCNFKSEEYAKLKSKVDKKMKKLEEDALKAKAFSNEERGDGRRRGSKFYMDKLNDKVQSDLKKREIRVNNKSDLKLADDMEDGVARNQSLIQYMRQFKSSSGEDVKASMDMATGEVPYSIEKGKTPWEIKHQNCSKECRLTLRGALVKIVGRSETSSTLRTKGSLLISSGGFNELMNEKLAQSFRLGWGIVDSKWDLGKMQDIHNNVQHYDPADSLVGLDSYWFLKDEVVGRQILRRNRLVLQCLERWFRLVDPEKVGIVSERQYVRLNKCLYHALMPAHSPEGVTSDMDAAMLAIHDFEIDRNSTPPDFKGGDLSFIPKYIFFNSMFQLADLWTYSNDPLEYAQFLNAMLHRITVGSPSYSLMHYSTDGGDEEGIKRWPNSGHHELTSASYSFGHRTKICHGIQDITPGPAGSAFSFDRQHEMIMGMNTANHNVGARGRYSGLKFSRSGFLPRTESSAPSSLVPSRWAADPAYTSQFHWTTNGLEVEAQSTPIKVKMSSTLPAKVDKSDVEQPSRRPKTSAGAPGCYCEKKIMIRPSTGGEPVLFKARKKPPKDQRITCSEHGANILDKAWTQKMQAQRKSALQSSPMSQRYLDESTIIDVEAVNELSQSDSTRVLTNLFSS